MQRGVAYLEGLKAKKKTIPNSQKTNKNFPVSGNTTETPTPSRKEIFLMPNNRFNQNLQRFNDYLNQ